MGVLKILDELGRPHVFTIPPEQFAWEEGDRLHGDCGIASVILPVVTINPGLRGKVRDNTIYHEIGHRLYPSYPHWWIECWAEKLARGGGRGYYSKKHGHTPDELQSRERLIANARRQSAKYNARLEKLLSARK